jgi:hypothetical protein
MFQVSGSYSFSRDIIQDEEFMEAYVADRAAPPVDVTASSSNGELPVTLMILMNHVSIEIHKSRTQKFKNACDTHKEDFEGTSCLLVLVCPGNED